MRLLFSKVSAISRRCLNFLSFALIGIFCLSFSLVLEASNIPFLGGQTAFEIKLPVNKDLRALLEKEIERQRQTNLELKQFTTPGKIARYESQILNTRLRAEGYYGNQVKIDLKSSEDTILYHVEPGPLYRVQEVIFQTPDSIRIPQNAVQTSPGEPLRAEVVLADKKSLMTYVAANACLYDVETDYRVLIDHQTQAAEVIFFVKDSPSVRFGSVVLSGLESVDESYLIKRLPFEEGDCFSRNHIDNARLTLIQTNLLVSVNAVVSEPVDEAVDVNLRVVERQHRTFSAGVGFESEEGFGVSAGWEHRNLWNAGQKLSIESHVADITQSVSAELTFPNYRRNNQTITFYTDIERENTDAFESKTGAVGVDISRPFGRYTTGILGSDLAYSRVEEDGEKDGFSMLSFPLSLEYDRRNDELDPRSGWVAAGRIRPYTDLSNEGVKFLKSTLAASAYATFDEVFWRPTIAMRGALGTITGLQRDRVPANIRFYSGGGGSVRGYPFQSLGPLTDGEPDGGLSFTEFSIETRLRWGEHWGGVLFLDGGFAYQESLKQADEDLLWGAGLGIRYYTSFAPIRFDFAKPLDRRDGIDDSFQIYISIGQAF